MRKSASIIGKRGQRGENDHQDQSCPYGLAGKPRRERRAGTGQSGDIAGFMLRADTEGNPANRTGEADGQKKTAPARGPEKACPASAFRRELVLHPVRIGAPPLLPFGHAALKTGSAMPRPIASKPVRADYRWKIVSPL
jgi:hypothetical protein